MGGHTTIDAPLEYSVAVGRVKLINAGVRRAYPHTLRSLMLIRIRRVRYEDVEARTHHRSLQHFERGFALASSCDGRTGLLATSE